MKDELGQNILTKFLALRPKMYSSLKHNNNEKIKGTKNFPIKQRLKFEDYKNCPQANQLENKKNN